MQPPQQQQQQQQQQPLDQQQQQTFSRSASTAHQDLRPQNGKRVTSGAGNATSTCTEAIDDPAGISDLRALAEEIRQEFRAMQQGLQMLETTFGDELRACKEAIRVEVSQREEHCTQLERSFSEAIEEESDRRQTSESRLDARVGALHADISARLKEELSDTLDELQAALAGRSKTRDHSEASAPSTPCALTTQRGPSMSPLEERPEQELLERLGEAVEGEAAARRALENWLQVQVERLASEAEARAEALSVQAPELGTILSEQDMLFKAVANLDSKIGCMQRDLHLYVQQMGQQSAEIITEMRASKGQDAFQAASKVLSMSKPASSGDKPSQGW